MYERSVTCCRADLRTKGFFQDLARDISAEIEQRTLASWTRELQFERLFIKEDFLAEGLANNSSLPLVNILR